MIIVHAYVRGHRRRGAVRFYTAALGLTVRRHLIATWVELAGAAIPVHLLGDRPTTFTAGTVALERRFSRHWTRSTSTFVVDDLAPAIGRARAAGAVIEHEVDHHGYFAMANCADPFGNGFDLIQEHPGGYDKPEARRTSSYSAAASVVLAPMTAATRRGIMAQMHESAERPTGSESAAAAPRAARTATRALPPAGAARAVAALPQRVGNGAFGQSLSRAPGRLPAPSAAAAVPARIKGMQQEFHATMDEANRIAAGTKFHYDYVNGIYSETFKIHQVVLGQAAAAQLQSDRVADAILAGAALAAKFAPATAAASVVIQVWQVAKKIEGVASKLGKVKTIAQAVAGPGDKKDGGDDKGVAPAEPNEFRIMGLENVVRVMQDVATARSVGDSVLDVAVDLSTTIGADAPDSGAITTEQSAALAEAEAACQELIEATKPLLTELQTLAKRRTVPVPSWAEVEQDIWIAYISHTGDPASPLIRSHMVDLGLWGPPGNPGGRLGIADEVSGVMRYEGTKTLPGHEDDAKQQSVPPKTVGQAAIMQTEAAALPAKWAKIMLFQD